MYGSDSCLSIGERLRDLEGLLEAQREVLAGYSRDTDEWLFTLRKVDTLKYLILEHEEAFRQALRRKSDDIEL